MLQGVENHHWKALIDTLLGTLAIPYQLDITDQKIIIKTDFQYVQTLQDHLSQVLRTSDDFYANLPYKIKTLDTVKTDATSSELPATAPRPLDTVEQGVAIFRTIFGEDNFNEIALDLPNLFNKKRGAYSQDRVLYSKPAKGKQTAQIWHDFLNALLASFNEVNALQLRRVWNSEASLPNFQEELTSTEFLKFNGLIQQCFGVIEDKEKKQVRLFFNYGLLHQLIFAPELTVTPEGSIHLDKQHLLNYVQQLTQAGMLLRIYKASSPDTRFIGQPIFFGGKKFNELPNHLTVIIDRSGSMEPYFDMVSDDVVTFLEKYKTLDDKARVKIVFFNQQTGPSQEFSIAETWKIRSFVKSTQAGGGTRLYGTIEDEISTVLENKIKQDQNAGIVFFTDGYDTVENKRNEAIERIIAKLDEFQQKGIKLPKLFTMGIGKYDHEALKLFAEKTQSLFIHMQTPDDFAAIYNSLNTLRYEQELLSFLISASDTTVFQVPVTLDGNVHVPAIRIPFQEKDQVVLGVKDQKMWVQLHNPALVPLATSNDHYQYFVTEVLSTVASEALPQEKIKSLEKIKEEVLKAQSKLEQTDSMELDHLFSKVLGKLSEITHTHNVALEESMKLQAQHSLGSIMVESKLPTTLLHLFEEKGDQRLPPHYQSIPTSTNNGPVKAPSPAQPAVFTGLHEPTLYEKFFSWWGPATTAESPIVPAGPLARQIEELTPPTSTSARDVTATCVPHAETTTEGSVYSIHCRTPAFDAEIFAKFSPHNELSTWTTEASSGEPGDTYDLGSCQAVEYNGKPALSCEGKETTAIIKPILPPKPLENLAGNIALGAVLLRLASDFVAWIKKPDNGSEPAPSQAMMREKPLLKSKEELLKRLSSAEQKIAQFSDVQSEKYRKRVRNELADYRERLEKMTQQLSSKGVSKEDWRDLEGEIKEFAKAMAKDFSASAGRLLQNEVRERMLTPGFEQQKERTATDYGQLIQAAPVVRDNPQPSFTLRLK